MGDDCTMEQLKCEIENYKTDYLENIKYMNEQDARIVKLNEENARLRAELTALRTVHFGEGLKAVKENARLTAGVAALEKVVETSKDLTRKLYFDTGFTWKQICEANDKLDKALAELSGNSGELEEKEELS